MATSPIYTMAYKAHSQGLFSRRVIRAVVAWLVLVVGIYIIDNGFDRSDAIPMSKSRFMFYPAYGRACIVPGDPEDGGYPVPRDIHSAPVFDPTQPITLIVDCAHNNGHFNPFHWSIAVWQLQTMLANESVAIKEVVVPCRPRDLNLDRLDLEVHSWPAFYWNRTRQLADHRKTPIRFTNRKEVCLDNAIHLTQMDEYLGLKSAIEPIRDYTLETCGLPPPQLHPGSEKHVLLLTRPNTRTFSHTDIAQFKKAAEGLGLKVSIAHIPERYCEQVKLLGSGNFAYLVAPHGAQLLTTLFMAKGSHVFEFWPPGFTARSYCFIKYAADLRWAYVYPHEASKNSLGYARKLEFSEQCEEAEEELSLCQKNMFCRKISKMLTVKMYLPEEVARHISLLSGGPARKTPSTASKSTAAPSPSSSLASAESSPASVNGTTAGTTLAGTTPELPEGSPSASNATAT